MPAQSIDYDTFEALCRGDYVLAPKVTKKLTCFYATKNHPFLRLAPIKVEQLFIDPDVYILPNILSDREIKHLKRKARPDFRRATVFNSDTAEMENASFRICKSASLDEDDVIRPIAQRISDFSGLSTDTAEDLQVVNYGIGGHYDPHFDHLLQSENPNILPNGNRLATVLFYMSEVAQGGATVFPVLGLSVFPVKNAALFWLNLHPSGEGDSSMLHAGCPVLQGSKWVSTKWIHIVGQEFRRPCSLEYQPEEMVRQFAEPIVIPSYH